MGRPKRAADGGLVYHVLNRANARLPIFEKDGDYEAFERVLAEAVERTETRLLAYCVLRNHWHLVVWPREDGELSRFTGWLTLTHTQRWHAHRHNAGSGHVYQGRFKSFPVQDDDHFYTVCRYVGEETGEETGTGPVVDNLGKDGYVLGMPRSARVAPGGMVFHVLNRARTRRLYRLRRFPAVPTCRGTLETRGISRFSRLEFPQMHRVSDSAAS